MKISLSNARIEELAQRRDVELAKKHVDGLEGALRGEHDLMERMRAAAERKHMTLSDLIAVAKWKWRGGRTWQLCKKNSVAEVEEITRVSFAAETERLHIGVLLALRGVSWPMASVILHFAYLDRNRIQFPILDVMTMRAVGGPTRYAFEEWQEYVDLCRAAATRHGVGMRTLDKALWQAGKESS